MSELQVELLQAGSGQVSGRPVDYLPTREDGKFVFAEVVAGRYVLAVNSIGRRSLYGAPFLPSYFPQRGIERRCAGHHYRRRRVRRCR